LLEPWVFVRNGSRVVQGIAGLALFLGAPVGRPPATPPSSVWLCLKGEDTATSRTPSPCHPWARAVSSHCTLGFADDSAFSCERAIPAWRASNSDCRCGGSAQFLGAIDNLEQHPFLWHTIGDSINPLFQVFGRFLRDLAVMRKAEKGPRVLRMK
jgi:hypothetical protein